MATPVERTTMIFILSYVLLIFCLNHSEFEFPAEIYELAYFTGANVCNFESMFLSQLQKYGGWRLNGIKYGYNSTRQKRKCSNKRVRSKNKCSCECRESDRVNGGARLTKRCRLFASCSSPCKVLEPYLRGHETRYTPSQNSAGSGSTSSGQRRNSNSNFCEWNNFSKRVLIQILVRKEKLFTVFGPQSRPTESRHHKECPKTLRMILGHGDFGHREREAPGERCCFKLGLVEFSILLHHAQSSWERFKRNRNSFLNLLSQLTGINLINLFEHFLTGSLKTSTNTATLEKYLSNYHSLWPGFGVHRRHVVAPAFLPSVTSGDGGHLDHVGYRLASLAAVPASCRLSRVRLAEAGFHYQPALQPAAVLCHQCGATYSLHPRPHLPPPLQFHRQQSPQCQFVTAFLDTFIQPPPETSFSVTSFSVTSSSVASSSATGSSSGHSLAESRGARSAESIGSQSMTSPAAVPDNTGRWTGARQTSSVTRESNGDNPNTGVLNLRGPRTGGTRNDQTVLMSPGELGININQQAFIYQPHPPAPSTTVQTVNPLPPASRPNPVWPTPLPLAAARRTTAGGPSAHATGSLDAVRTFASVNNPTNAFRGGSRDDTSAGMLQNSTRLQAGSVRQEFNNCLACRVKPATVMFLPCGHLVFCGSCQSVNARVNKCPFCQKLGRSVGRALD